MTGQRPRTVVLGFDGLAFEYLDAFDLPNFSRLRSRGVEAPLRSTFPPWTGNAWPSMYTGVDPSHHGVYDFFDFAAADSPDEAGIVTRNHVEAPALWNYLSAEGVPAVVLNMPVTHPAEPIEGVLLPGYLASEDVDGHPPGIRAELADALGEYRIYSRAETDEADDRLDAYLELIDLRRRAAAYLLREKPWELAVVQVQKTDAVFHHYTDEAAFRAVYEAADELLGTVLDTVEENANVVVCSDHGVGPVTGYRIYVNEVLREHGFVEAATGPAGTPELARRKRELTGVEEEEADASVSGGLTAAAFTAAESVLSRVGISPGDVYAVAQRLGVGAALEAHLPDAVRGTVGEAVDWRASRAYCRSKNELGVRVNLAGRDPHGVVPPAAYEATRDELVDALTALRTPDGEPAFDWVKRREAVYDGPHADAACDVLFLPAGMNHTVSTSLIGTRFVPVDTYHHTLSGVFVGAGPGFADGAAVEPFSLTDVAPVVMALLGYPVPERMTGSVPPGLLSVEATRREYGDVPYGSAAARPATDPAVERRLEDLGYR